MATTQSTFMAIVKGDTSQAVTEFRKFGNEVQKNTAQVQKSIQQTEKDSSGRFDKFAGKASAAFSVGALVMFGKHVVDAGSALQAMDAKSRTVFEGQISRVNAWSKANASALGLTTTEATAAGSAIADLLKPMGFTAKAATDQTLKMMDLAGALSAWSGGQRSATEVSQTLVKAMLGEREELKGLGISITEAEVQAKLLAKGQEDLTGTALQQAKAMATQELIIAKSTDAQKAWASGAMDGQKQANASKASFRQLSETLSRQLYPSLVSIAAGLAKAADVATPLVSGVAKVVAVVTGSDAKNMSKPIADFHREIAGLTTTGLPKVLAAFGDLKHSAGENRSSMDKATTSVKGFFGGLTGGTPVAEENLRNIRKAFSDLSAQSPNDARMVVKALDALRDAARSGNGEAQSLMKRWGLDSAEVDSFIRSLGVVTTSIQGNSDAGKQAAANRMYAKHLRDEADAAGRDEASHRNLIRAMQDLDEIRKDEIDTTVKSWTAMNDARKALDDYNETVADSESTLLEQQSAAIDVATAMAEASAAVAEANGHTQTAAEKAWTMAGALGDLARQLDRKSPLRQQLEEYIRQLLSVPTNINTSLSISDASGRPPSANGAARGPDGERLPSTGGATVVNHITINTKADPNDVITVIKQYVRSGGRGVV